jgi:hypothetical protein
MTTQSGDPIQNFWDDLLSSEPDRIRAVFATLDWVTQSSALAHLHAMAEEDGWHPLQKASAQAALNVLETPPDQNSGSSVQ